MPHLLGTAIARAHLTPILIGAALISTPVLGQAEEVEAIEVYPSETQTLVDVQVIGPDGQAINPENLPPELQARIAESMLAAEAGMLPPNAQTTATPRASKVGPNAAAMETVRKQRLDRLQKKLGSSDDEFTLLKPLIQKIQWLKAIEQGRFAPKPKGLTTADQAHANQLFTARAKAEGLAQSPSATPESSKAALNSLRTARASLTKARITTENELRPLLTAKQELALVLNGVLE